MILVHTFPASVSEAGGMASDTEIGSQLEFHERLAEAGALIDAAGFHPTGEAWRVVQREDGARELVDGPFDDDRLVAGETRRDLDLVAEVAPERERRAPHALADDDPRERVAVAVLAVVAPARTDQLMKKYARRRVYLET